MTTKARILVALKVGPMTARQIAAAIDMPLDGLRPYMTQLYADGKLTREKARPEVRGQRTCFLYTRADAPAT